MSFRKDLCADALVQGVRLSLYDVSDSRFRVSKTVELTDILMSGYALFSLKMPSLLAFDNLRNDQIFQANMKNLFGVENIPSDTRMREVLDEVDPNQLRGTFKCLFVDFQRGKCLDEYLFFNDHYLVALDGTQYFSSKSVHCDDCLSKTSKKSGEVTYYHQMVGAVIIHPDNKIVIPLCPEPIFRQDGSSKNDCEKVAVSRWLEAFRKDHPKLKVIITEDGLSSNGPHIKDLTEHNCSYILGAKPGDHKYLFEQFHLADSAVQEIIVTQGKTKHTFRFINGLSLNEANANLLVNFLYYEEENEQGKKIFSWVTDIELNSNNVFFVMKGGRARWKIENETFNTLKNQGYNFEHNYGHGNKNLSVVLALLMFLAFVVDFHSANCLQSFSESKS